MEDQGVGAGDVMFTSGMMGIHVTFDLVVYIINIPSH